MRSRNCIVIAIGLAGCGAPPPAATPAHEVAKTASAPAQALPEPAKTSPAAPAKPAAAPKAPVPVATTPPKPAPSIATAPAKPATPVALAPAKPALDLGALEQRLKETSAIGVLTKLSLKNQVDDLVAHFRAFHGGQRPPTLADLRPAFDLLLMKVLSLLQDKDAALATEIHTSREAIWGVLSDRDKFSRIN